jgi:hypothetical protein
MKAPALLSFVDFSIKKKDKARALNVAECDGRELARANP